MPRISSLPHSRLKGQVPVATPPKPVLIGPGPGLRAYPADRAAIAERLDLPQPVALPTSLPVGGIITPK